MAVTYDAVGPAGGGGANGTATPLEWAHVNSGNCVVVAATSDTGTSNLVTGVTYGGVTLPFLKFVISNNSVYGGIALYGGVSGVAGVGTLPTGSNTVSVAFTGAASTIGGSVSAASAGSLGTPVSNYGAAGNMSVTVPGTTSGGLVVVAGCEGATGGTWGGSNGVALRWSRNVASDSGADNAGGGTVASAVGDQTAGLTIDVSDYWGLVAVEVLPVTGTSFTATPAAADGGGEAQAATGAAGQSTAVLYAGSATGISGSWSGTGNATGSTQGTYATWTDSAAGSSAVLELSAFGAQSGVPSGSAVTQVNCVVRHGEAPASAVASVTAQAYSGSTPVGSPQPLTAADAVHDDPVTFTGLAWADLADLRVRVTVTRD